MLLGDIKSALQQILSIIADEQKNSQLGYEILLKTPGTLFHTKMKESNAFGDLRQTLCNFLANEIPAPGFTFQPECNLYIKEPEQSWDSEVAYPTVTVTSSPLAKLEELNDDQVAADAVEIAANDIKIYFNYPVDPVLNYFISLDLLIAEEKIPADDSHMINAHDEPSSDSETSDDSVENANSDEELGNSHNHSVREKEVKTEQSTQVESKQYFYRFKLATLGSFHAGLTPGIDEKFRLEFINGVKKAMNEHKQITIKEYLSTLPGKIQSIEEVTDDKSASPQDSTTSNFVP